MCTIPMHMAASADTPSPISSGSATPGPTARREKTGSKLWLTVGALLLIGANVGFWFYRIKTQERAVREMPALQASAQSSESVPLEPFVVNLAGGDGYLKVAITLVVGNGEPRSRQAPKLKNTSQQGLESALVRDTILNTLSAQDAGTLLTVQGKEALKKALKSALDAKDPGHAVTDVYFTEFLVER